MKNYWVVKIFDEHDKYSFLKVSKTISFNEFIKQMINIIQVVDSMDRSLLFYENINHSNLAKICTSVIDCSPISLSHDDEKELEESNIIKVCYMYLLFQHKDFDLEKDSRAFYYNRNGNNFHIYESLDINQYKYNSDNIQEYVFKNIPHPESGEYDLLHLRKKAKWVYIDTKGEHRRFIILDDVKDAYAILKIRIKYLLIKYSNEYNSKVNKDYPMHLPRKLNTTDILYLLENVYGYKTTETPRKCPFSKSSYRYLCSYINSDVDLEIMYHKQEPETGIFELISYEHYYDDDDEYYLGGYHEDEAKTEIIDELTYLNDKAGKALFEIDLKYSGKKQKLYYENVINNIKNIEKSTSIDRDILKSCESLSNKENKDVK